MKLWNWRNPLHAESHLLTKSRLRNLWGLQHGRVLNAMPQSLKVED